MSLLLRTRVLRQFSCKKLTYHGARNFADGDKSDVSTAAKIFHSKLLRRLAMMGVAASGMATYFHHHHRHNDQHDKYSAGVTERSEFPLLRQSFMASAAKSLTNEKRPSQLFVPPDRPDLPVFGLDEVKKHGKGSDHIWVIFKQGVYDVTNFVESHPGGEKILLAAGGSVESFWAIYAQHKTAEVMEILESLRIGSLDPEDLKSQQPKDENDPFSTDPDRHPALIVNSRKPFNAETPPSLLLDAFRTPNELFFVRNHMPVPQTDKQTHRLEVDGLGVGRPVSLSVADLRANYEPVHVTSVVQCAGNRRNDMNAFKRVQGLMWTGTAISNAKWTGCRLRDVLIAAGVDPTDKRIKHVHFEGADKDATGTHYGASIPFEKAMRPETIVAYEMNGEEIPADHGFPLRVICPGIVGARQVKWLTRVSPSAEESPSHWQRKDYRAFSPAVQIGDPVDYDSVPAIQEYPIQSAICTPAPNSRIDKEDGSFEVCGYAWSGGGRGIIRVEVSADGGKTWQSAHLEQDPDQDLEHMWAWTLWRVEVKIPEELRDDRLEVLCKATDRAYNTQPETAAGLWNVRGLLHNAWHRVPLQVVMSDGAVDEEKSSTDPNFSDS